MQQSSNMKKLILSCLILLAFNFLSFSSWAHINESKTNRSTQEVSFKVKVKGEKAIQGASVSVYNGTTILAAGKTNSQGIASIIIKNFNGEPIIIKIT